MSTSKNKPVVNLSNTSGNIFAVVGVVTKVLKRAGKVSQAIKMQERIHNAKSYGEALSIVGEYVEVDL